MWKFALALTFFSLTSAGADFGVINFGDSCATLKPQEEARASVSVGSWTEEPRDFVHAFRTREFNQEVVIVYICPSGHLTSGNYFLPIEPRDQAVNDLRKVRELLVSEFGSPFLD